MDFTWIYWAISRKRENSQSQYPKVFNKVFLYSDIVLLYPQQITIHLIIEIIIIIITIIIVVVINLAQDKEQLRASVNAVTNFKFP
jgi:hypothetical protein